MVVLNKYFARVVGFIFLFIAQALFYSCHISKDYKIICNENFKIARNLAETNPTDTLALDSALTVINRCLQCESIKLAVVDVKIRLLLSLRKFKEGSEFVDSLSVTDFVYPYKKKLYYGNFLVREFESNMDTVKRNIVYKQMSSDLEKYIRENSLGTQEFEEAFLELYSLKENFTDSSEINREIDSLEIKYPNKVTFFEFLR